MSLESPTSDQGSSIYWFAVHTKPRQERLAETNLQNQQFRTYLPLVVVAKRRRGKWVDVVEPLFPRYLFIQMNPVEASIAPIRSTIGVSGIVRFGNTLKPVPNSVIGFLKHSEDPGTGWHRLDQAQFQPGTEVEILDGPFAGLKGVYQLAKGKERALILIDLLGRQNTVNIRLDDFSHL